MSGIEALKSNLDAYIKRYYLIRLLRGLLLWLGLSILLFILWSTLEYFNRFSSGTRAFLFWSYLSLFGAWLFFLVALPLFRMLRLIRTFDYREAAVKIGRRLKGLDEHLLDTLSFSEQRENSDLLIQALEQKALRFQNISFKSLIKLSELRRLASLSSIPIVLMPFDSFYVSLLSEKNATGRMRPLRAFWQGLRSNMSGRKTKNMSSLIYVLRKTA